MGKLKETYVININGSYYLKFFASGVRGGKSREVRFSIFNRDSNRLVSRLDFDLIKLAHDTIINKKHLLPGDDFEVLTYKWEL